MNLTDIYIYPVKSLTGVRLKQAKVTPTGLHNDRTLMLVDSDGTFISQRKYPKMALIKTSPGEQQLKVSAPNMATLDINLSEILSNRVPVKVWNDECYGYSANDGINQWFSDFLGTSLRLISYDYQSPRACDPDYSESGDTVSFADGFPLLVISQASLDDLNNRLKNPVTMTRFRPNIVVSGCKAFAEDNWKRIRIGEVEFEAVKPCSRCILTTVDPETGEKSSNGEPLKTLSQYRRRPEGVCFGINLIPRNRGNIDLNDPVEVIE